MSTPRRLAISYSRFSDPKQAGGDSEDRQARMFRTFCEQHNLTPLTEIFADRGRSGYHDEHRKKGRLGQLVAMAKDGRFEPGTVIVVEAWDRLGRLVPNKMIHLIEGLVENGVAIGVCRLNDIFVEADFGTHKWTTLSVFIQIAYQESKQKAERVSASWDRRWNLAREEGRLMTSRLPGWLEVVNKKPRIIPERAAIVKTIFEMAAAGVGHRGIIKHLHDGGIKPFSPCDRWNRSYVAVILGDKRACGIYQPRRNGESVGDAIELYPAIITEDLYNAARVAQEKKLGTDKRGRAIVPRQRKYVNTFRGLLTHAKDNQSLMLHNRSTASNPSLVLVTSSGQSGRTRMFSFPYLVFERAILALLREIDPAEILPGTKKDKSQADVLRSKLEIVRADIAQIEADIKEGYSKRLSAILKQKEAEEEQIATELQEELAKSARPTEKAWQELPSLVGTIEKEGDEARLRLRPVLRRVIESGHVLIVQRGVAKFAVVQLHFKGDGIRSYLVWYRPAGRGRAEKWEAKSFASPIVDLDLRNPEHAAKLEKSLASV
jgi:hypothetical protein